LVKIEFLELRIDFFANQQQSEKALHLHATPLRNLAAYVVYTSDPRFVILALSTNPLFTVIGAYR
jgi:hypothetical protein